MKITIEVDEVEEAEQLIEWLQQRNIMSSQETTVSVKVNDYKPTITKGDKSIDSRALEGIWKDNPRTIEEIRRADRL